MGLLTPYEHKHNIVLTNTGTYVRTWYIFPDTCCTYVWNGCAASHIFRAGGCMVYGKGCWSSLIDQSAVCFGSSRGAPNRGNTRSRRSYCRCSYRACAECSNNYSRYEFLMFMYYSGVRGMHVSRTYQNTCICRLIVNDVRIYRSLAVITLSYLFQICMQQFHTLLSSPKNDFFMIAIIIMLKYCMAKDPYHL